MVLFEIENWIFEFIIQSNASIDQSCS